jgi:hypothetical protein
MLVDRRHPGSGLARAEVASFLLALAGSAATALETSALRGRKALLRGDQHGGRSHRRQVASTPAATRWRVTVIASFHQATSIRGLLGRLPARRRRLGSAGDRLLAPRLRQAHHPEYVDKATKLETSTTASTRSAPVEVLATPTSPSGRRRAVATGPPQATRDAEWRRLDDDFAFIAHCNRGSEA